MKASERLGHIFRGLPDPQWWCIFLPLFGLFVFTLSVGPGCCSSELQKQAQLSEERVSAFVVLMEAAQTERQDEQDFIRACGEMFTAIREASGVEPIGGAR
jgi:hypothetical protein